MKCKYFFIIICLVWSHGYFTAESNYYKEIDIINKKNEEKIFNANNRTIAMFGLATEYKLKLDGERNEKNINNCIRNYNSDCLRFW